MRYLFLVIIFVFLGGNISPLDAGTPVKVMTYNIRLDFSGDGEDNWEYRKSDLASYIQEQDADFVAIQEALFHQVKFLEKALKGYQYIGVGRDNGLEKGEFMALFFKAGHWTPEMDSTFWLSATPASPSMGWDAACFRVCTYGVFRNKNGDSLAVWNTHFDHVGKLARKNSVEVLKTEMIPLIKKYPSILTGDFNVEPSESVYLALNDFLTDSRSGALIYNEASIGTFNAFKTEGSFDRRIDYVFVDQKNLSILCYQVEMPLTQSGRQLSDHFPVIVSIEIQ